MFWYHPSAQDDKREPAFGRNNKNAIFFFFLKKKSKKNVRNQETWQEVKDIKLFFLPSVKTAKKCTLNIPLFETINYPFVR